MSGFVRSAAGCAFNLFTKRPVLAIFDVTKICNQHCPMCNIPLKKSRDMSLDEISRKALEMKKAGIKYVYLQGGEPLTRKDIIEIADIFISNKIKPTIITNGALLNHDILEKIASRPCNLSISIDSLDKDKYAFLRGSADLEKVMETVKSSPVRERRTGNWSITATITGKSTLEDVRNIENFAAKYGFMFAVRPYIATGNRAGRTDENLIYSKDDVIGIFEHYINKAKKENYPAYLVYREHINYISGKKMPPCDALRYSVLCKENGDYAPCIEMPDIKINPEKIKQEQKKHAETIRKCNCETPCFYNDAREIGILYRHIPEILIHLPLIIRQTKNYGSFF